MSSAVSSRTPVVSSDIAFPHVTLFSYLLRDVYTYHEVLFLTCVCNPPSSSVCYLVLYDVWYDVWHVRNVCECGASIAFLHSN